MSILGREMNVSVLLQMIFNCHSVYSAVAYNNHTDSNQVVCTYTYMTQFNELVTFIKIMNQSISDHSCKPVSTGPLFCPSVGPVSGAHPRLVDVRH